jgi:cytochrome P450
LPPGRFLQHDPAERLDQKYQLKNAVKFGPVFKAVFEGKLTVCVIGIARCRRFLQEHSANITPDTIKLQTLFPSGFLRGMKGEEHKQYRRTLIQAIDPGILLRDYAVFEETIADELARYADDQQEEISPPEIYIETLNNIASSLLFYVFFGARVGSGRFEILMRLYHELGPNGVEWSIGDQQQKIFNEIRDYLLRQLEEQSGDKDPCLQQSVMGRMHNNGVLDATSLGNLIYMVEMGRYDMHSLFRWLSKYGAENPGLLELIGAQSKEKQENKVLLSEAFVRETLRLNQSERLMRVVDRHIIFDGYQIPKNFRVRLCLWESHKLPESFEQPFSFKPERFIAKAVGKDQFSPFGLQHHSCPFADISIRLSSIFIEVLAAKYSVIPVADGPPVRGQFHWQPASRFSVRLRER